MKTECACGVDCSDFISQHSIPANARFNCPACEAELRARATQSGFPSADLTEPVYRPSHSFGSSIVPS